MPSHVDFDSSTASLVLALGLLFSLVCYAFTNLSPGGMIVPGWLALTLVEGLDTVVVTGAAMVATFGAAKLLQRWSILYGKRLFAIVVLVGVFLEATAFLALHDRLPQLFPHDTLGFVVPGLVAYQLVRQPKLPTLVATSVVTLASALVAITVMAL
jgi:poly-gamma-glutamate biosynthesis protein PgsC/CapC